MSNYYIGMPGNVPFLGDYLLEVYENGTKARYVCAGRSMSSYHHQEYDLNIIWRQLSEKSWVVLHKDKVPVWADTDKKKAIDLERSRLKNEVITTEKKYNEARHALVIFDKENPE